MHLNFNRLSQQGQFAQYLRGFRLKIQRESWQYLNCSSARDRPDPSLSSEQSLIFPSIFHQPAGKFYISSIENAGNSI